MSFAEIHRIEMRARQLRAQAFGEFFRTLSQFFVDIFSPNQLEKNS